jgi:hypothetical protein
VIRRSFLLVAGAVAVAQRAQSEPLRPPERVENTRGGGAIDLSDLKWTGKAPTFPLFRAVASGDFRGEVEARIATRSEPIRYRSYLAFYRLAAALGSKLVPRTAVFAVRLPDLLLALRGDPAGLSLLREDLAVQNDGTVAVMVSEPIAVAREIDFSGGPEVRLWRAWAEGRAGVSAERWAIVSGYIEALVLDYLAGEARRSIATMDNDFRVLHLIENGGAFSARPDPQGLDMILAELKRVTRFPRGFVQRLRAFDRGSAERALHAGPFVAWLVASRPISEMMERRDAVLSLIGARVAELGEGEALGFP